MVVGAVLSQTTGVGLKVVGTPIEAHRKAWENRIVARIERTRAAADRADGVRPLAVSDRVAYKALTEAAFNDDELTADYLGGVVAASGPDDDDGVPMVALISRLSSRQLLFHYLGYQALRAAASDSSLGAPVPPFHEPDKLPPRLRVGVSAETLVALSGLGGAQVDPPVLTSLTRQLISEDLIESDIEIEALREFDPDVAATITFRPTVLGAELFVWGHGVPRQSAHANQIFNPALSFELLADTPPAFRVDEVIPYKEPSYFVTG